jgi:hypothetical protein
LTVLVTAAIFGIIWFLASLGHFKSKPKPSEVDLSKYDDETRGAIEHIAGQFRSHPYLVARRRAQALKDLSWRARLAIVAIIFFVGSPLWFAVINDFVLPLFGY